jgi:DnaJ-domain-containing protein 1
VPEDYFALLDEPRRPWVDPGAVQSKFLALSTEVHPDRVHNAGAGQKSLAHDRFAVLNAACNCLRDPKARLRHLLELERGSGLDHLERLPSSAMDFYFSLGQVCRQIDQFLAEPGKCTSPLLQVQRFQAAMNWVEKLEPEQAELRGRQQALESQLRELNPIWERAPDIGTADRLRYLPLGELEQIYREWSYLVRWRDEVRDRIVRLSL